MEILNEEQLDEVAGGIFARNCFFEPENPPTHKVENGEVRVRCKSVCHAPHPVVRISCSCNRKHECVDRWHIIEQANPGSGTGNWYAKPKDYYNHNENRKLIKNLFV